MWVKVSTLPLTGSMLLNTVQALESDIPWVEILAVRPLCRVAKFIYSTRAPGQESKMGLKFCLLSATTPSTLEGGPTGAGARRTDT